MKRVVLIHVDKHSLSRYVALGNATRHFPSIKYVIYDIFDGWKVASNLNNKNKTKQTRIWHVPAKHANRMDARAHTSILAECAPRFMTPRSQGFVGQSSTNLAHV